MERDTNIAFIPKAPLTTGTSSSRPISILFVVALVVFLAVVGTAGGLFIYKRVLQKDLAAQEQKIKELREDYEKNAEQGDIIRRAENLGIQVGAVQEILNNHLALTPLFDFLETHTLKDVQFTSFAFGRDDEGGLTATLEATANSYMAAALQREEFKRNTLEGVTKGDSTVSNDEKVRYPVSRFTISVPELTEEGAVSFTIELTLNSEALRYAHTIVGGTPPKPTPFEVSEEPVIN